MTQLSSRHQTMLELFQKHVNAELTGDIKTTMETMTEDPHLTNVANLAGGTGFEGVKNFYTNHLVGKFFPPDVEMTTVSRTIDDEQIVEELVIKFTHTMVMDWMLPKIKPTGKKVEVSLIVIVKFKDEKIAHEHIYWDQASVLVQTGLLDPKGLPVCGNEGPRKILNPKLPSRLDY